MFASIRRYRLRSGSLDELTQPRGVVMVRSLARRGAGLLAAVAGGAMAQYFFDRQQGARRRHVARDRTVSRVRSRAREAGRRVRYVEGVAHGAAYRAAHVLP